MIGHGITCDVQCQPVWKMDSIDDKNPLEKGFFTGFICLFVFSHEDQILIFRSSLNQKAKSLPSTPQVILCVTLRG